MMTDLRKGMLVQHTSLGLGKIVALETDAVHVFFEASERRFATKLRLASAAPFLSPALAKNAWLKGMGPLSLDAKTNRYGLATTWLTHDEAVARFLEAFPKGFADPKYLAEGKRKGDTEFKWRAAQAAFAEQLGGEGERLLAAGDVGELVRRALRVERIIGLVHPNPEKASLKDAFADKGAARDFFEALFALLAVASPDRARFEKVASAVAALPQGSTPALAWPLATGFAFLARPDRHMLVRPKATSDAAARLGFDIGYDAAPNWSTYSALLSFVELLLAKLAPIGARDHVDVDAFLQATSAKRG
jgi:hypothetical protein